MIPIHELLNRIRWDPEFAKGDFELGYYDRAENRMIMVPLKEVTFPKESPSTFKLTWPLLQQRKTAKRRSLCAVPGRPSTRGARAAQRR